METKVRCSGVSLLVHSLVSLTLCLLFCCCTAAAYSHSKDIPAARAWLKQFRTRVIECNKQRTAFAAQASMGHAQSIATLRHWHAAVAIQRTVRGFLARTTRKHRMNAIRLIQRCARGWLGRQGVFWKK